MMRSTITLIGAFFFVVVTHAQRFTITLKNDKVIHANDFLLSENLFRQSPNIIIARKRINIVDVDQINDQESGFTYKSIRFRNRTVLARELEKGRICLYDLQMPGRGRIQNNRRIATNNRFYYHHKGDEVLSALNRKGFDKLFDSSFSTAYPQYASIRKNYLRLHNRMILSSIMLPNLVTAAGFQSLGLLVPYLATTTWVTGSALIGRQTKFKRVRQMVKTFNAQSRPQNVMPENLNLNLNNVP